MNGAIILAAGQGTRYKGKKQYEIIKGKEMWKFVYDKVVQIVDPDKVVVVGVDIEGGDTRSGSVRKGLDYLEDIERVIIVEAARPLVTPEQIEELLSLKDKSAAFALPLVNTVIGRDGTYYDRNLFYDLLTPQAFDFDMLKAAYATGKYENTTDETIVMFQEYGIKPKFLIKGENLIKVTYARDIDIINAMLEKG